MSSAVEKFTFSDVGTTPTRSRLWGRVHNLHELRQALEMPNDAELIDVLRKGFERWDIELTNRLRGEFAFALWDEKRRRVFCARDKMGIQPFFYTQWKNAFFCSADLTELKKRLSAEGKSDWRADEKALTFFLSGVFVDQEATFYQELKRLPPAHRLLWSETGSVIERYWSLAAQSRLRYKTLREYEDHFNDVFLKAIVDRVHPEDRCGVFLSGGFDSASITAVANQVLGKESERRLVTISCEFKDPQADIREDLDSVLNLGSWTKVRLDVTDPAVSSQVDFEMDPGLVDLEYDPRFYLLRPLLSAARDRGISTTLVGFGGDDVFSPSCYFANWLQEFKIARAVKEASRWIQPEHSTLETLWNEGVRPLFSPLRSSSLGRLLPRPSPPHVHELARKKHAPMRALAKSHAENPSPFRDICRMKLYQRLFVNGAHAWVFEKDQMLAGRYGVRFSYPYYDERLIELSFQLPVEMWYGRGYEKFIARSSLRRLLPENICFNRNWQDYTGFLNDALLRQQPVFSGLLESSRVVDLGLVDDVELGRILHSPIAPQFVEPLLSTLAVEIWLRNLKQ